MMAEVWKANICPAPATMNNSNNPGKTRFTALKPSFARLWLSEVAPSREAGRLSTAGGCYRVGVLRSLTLRAPEDRLNPIHLPNSEWARLGANPVAQCSDRVYCSTMNGAL
jgi:hypothetical protein